MSEGRDKKEIYQTTGSGGLRERTWKRFLRGPDASLLEDLYVPALKEAVKYDRCCSYFSSSVLAAASRGFAGIISRIISNDSVLSKPVVRLIVNEELNRDDVRAMMETEDTSRLEILIRKRFKDPKDALEKERLAMLAWLVKNGWLEIKVAVMRSGAGIVHAKFGLIKDINSDFLVFSGSGNESASGLMANYENLELSTSWIDPERYDHYRKEFDLLWNNIHPDVYTVSLPEAIKNKLIKFAPPEAPVQEPSNIIMRQKAAMIWQFIAEAPYLNNGELVCDETLMVDLWPHQKQVVEEGAKAWPDGRLLCDEVGMGKTIEAIAIVRRLISGRGVRRVLFLLPAGIVKQWQSELREKGGIVAPRLEGLNYLVWPDDRQQRVSGLAEALNQQLLLMSRETARTDNNLPIILESDPWDLVILDEAHAARRKKQIEGEFNSPTLLLNLLRQLQYKRKARGFLLLSATPMQTHPWEPWDLMTVLGEGGPWVADFGDIRKYYAYIYDLENGKYNHKLVKKVSELINSSASEIDKAPWGGSISGDINGLINNLEKISLREKDKTADWLRRVSPLGRRMHRNTRETLKDYYKYGMISTPPPNRIVEDIIFDYEYKAEREVYTLIKKYIDKRFSELEAEKPGKGFVMTIYRRRATSSPYALKKSLERRLEGLKKVIERRAYDSEISKDEMLSSQDLDDLGIYEDKISAAFPTDPAVAYKEANNVQELLEKLNGLHGLDSKRQRFYGEIKKLVDEGRSVLIFTEYVDTMCYIRNNILDLYGQAIGCYSGDGGQLWTGKEWVNVPKDEITDKLSRGEIKVMVCTDAASEGLNLQAAGALINYDLPWNPSRVEQRIGRIDRIGQRHIDIKIINFFLKDSIDERVYGILRKRCGLFELFVGEMQPVLSKAREMLIGKEPMDVSTLENEVSRVKKDFMAAETYRAKRAAQIRQDKAPLNKEHMEKALDYLGKEINIIITKNKENNIYKIKGEGNKTINFSFNLSALESNQNVLPLFPGGEIGRLVSDKLSGPGEILPLVFGSYQDQGFRATLIYWIDKNKTYNINNFDTLERLISRWDGSYPDPKVWVQTKTRAEKLAKKIVIEMKKRADEKEKKGIERQLEAAKLRLLKELGILLVSYTGDIGDLNKTMSELIKKKDSLTANRLSRCLGRLGGYPQWPDSLKEELVEFLKTAKENDKKARILGKEVDAALDDPRWTTKI